jgi:Flp pilus assembly CpaF family ATPase
MVAAPAFAIRKPAVAVFTLDDHVAAGIMNSGQADALKDSVGARRNILVAGGTSSGKTTLTNALLAEVAKTSDRVVLIEDTRELQCKAPNLVALRTKDGVISLSDLVRSSLRLRPDRIPIGEVRRAEALDSLKAWGTGHPGGIGTIHAGTALGALRRLEQLIQEAVVTVPRALIAETINVVAVLSGRGAGRRLAELASVTGPITGIRSDLPGQITAQVTENVYDSPTGRARLIPQGARLIGVYDSQVAFGQSRALLDRLGKTAGRGCRWLLWPRGRSQQPLVGTVQSRAALDHPRRGGGAWIGCRQR